MKRHLLIFVMLLGAVSSWGQTAPDMAAVLQKIITLPELQGYLPSSNGDTQVQTVVMQYPVSFPDEVVNVIDPSIVAFRSLEAIQTGGVQAYFTFRSVKLTPSGATANFNLFYDYDTGSSTYKILIVDIQLQHFNTNWSVSNLNIGGVTR
ncbi:MAG: hypothetical protein PHP53_07025 [Prolixibacteraceae bacterium]|nr:hypothetical protein [Prolixibacteraceae bacterium]